MQVIRSDIYRNQIVVVMRLRNANVICSLSKKKQAQYRRPRTVPAMALANVVVVVGA